MRVLKLIFLFSLYLVFLSACQRDGENGSWIGAGGDYDERFRPQIHFSPRQNWMGPPAGLVHYKGKYHLFYTHNPADKYTGNSHWGHAVSEDLVHWKHQPMSLKPDSLGQILSGSVVVDTAGTSKLGGEGHTPMVALFTYKQKGSGEKIRYAQGLAYSVDEGKTWKKYGDNPVLNEGQTKAWRHPDVFWHRASRRWIMTLAGRGRTRFYASPDLKQWDHLSEFNGQCGKNPPRWSHPDLFPIQPADSADQQKWVLMVSTEKGGPSRGSASRYFVGDFDGVHFVNHLDGQRWLDYGKDFFAGQTFAGSSPDRRIVLGWMNNWQYAQSLPTSTWRGAMSLPREVSLQTIHNKKFLTGEPVREVKKLRKHAASLDGFEVAREVVLTEKLSRQRLPVEMVLNFQTWNHTQIGFAERFGVKLSGDSSRLILGYDNYHSVFYINRANSGLTDFSADFTHSSVVPYLKPDSVTTLRIILDRSSVEMFAEGGKRSATARYFSPKPMKRLSLFAENGQVEFLGGTIYELKGIW